MSRHVDLSTRQVRRKEGGGINQLSGLGVAGALSFSLFLALVVFAASSYPFHRTSFQLQPLVMEEGEGKSDAPESYEEDGSKNNVTVKVFSFPAFFSFVLFFLDSDLAFFRAVLS